MGGGAGVSSQEILDSLRKAAQMGVSDEDCLMLDAANRLDKLQNALQRILDFKFGWRGTNAHEDVEKLQQIAREALK